MPSPGDPAVMTSPTQQGSNENGEDILLMVPGCDHLLHLETM